MPFPPSLALRIRRQCHFQCCLCKDLGVEIHHVIPQADGGTDSEENAAPLCPSCHETYGANPTKRKFIREARDLWFEICAKRYTDESAILALQSVLARMASKDDIRELGAQIAEAFAAFRAPPHSISIPIEGNLPNTKRRLTIRDLLVLVHATSSNRPAAQLEILCIRELWPVGKDDWRGIYKAFLRRFGELTMHHLASRALNLEQVPHSEQIAEDDLMRALSLMRIEAMCMVLVDQGHIGAVLSESGDVLWTGRETRIVPS